MESTCNGRGSGPAYVLMHKVSAHSQTMPSPAQYIYLAILLFPPCRMRLASYLHLNWLLKTGLAPMLNKAHPKRYT